MMNVMKMIAIVARIRTSVKCKYVAFLTESRTPTADGANAEHLY